MALQYDPEDAATAWPEADYEAVLLSVKETTSKVKPDGSGGNPMEVWTCVVYGPNGKEQEIKDYVVVPGATFKIKQLANALGKAAEFKAGTFQAQDHINASFHVALSIESNPGFDDQNKINKYKPLATAGNGQTPRERVLNRPKAENPLSKAPVFEDDTSIPF